MPDRSALISVFLETANWDAAQRRTIAGDASNRRYERLTRHDGTTAILMDAPPDKGESTRPFVKITEFLRGAGLSAPHIYAQDASDGFLLLEDLGDDLFARILAKDPTMEQRLYEAATDVLLHLHTYDPPDLIRCDADMMTDMVSLAFTCYQNGALGYTDAAALAAFQAAFREVLKPLNTRINVMIQRDYHAENLLWLPDRSGVARVGLLDYQDALIGHRAYDLVSVLQDARRDVSPVIAQDMIHRYAAAAQIALSEFETDYALLGLQRNLRILGIFARLSLSYGKPHYADYIPRVWGHIQSNLRHPALREIAPLINAALPEPTPDILKGLKAKCVTIPLP